MTKLSKLCKHNGHYTINELLYTLFAPRANQQHNFDNIRENYYKKTISDCTWG